TLLGKPGGGSTFARSAVMPMQWQPLREPSTRAGRVTRLGKRIGLPNVPIPQGLASRPRSSDLLSITIVVPTYKEAENLPHLIDAVARVRDAHGLALTLLIMDDDSRDGSVEIVASRPETWVQIVVRTGDR